MDARYPYSAKMESSSEDSRWLMNSSPAEEDIASPFRPKSPTSTSTVYVWCTESERETLRSVCTLGHGSYWQPCPDTASLYFKASLAILAQSLIWVGVWDLLSEEIVGHNEDRFVRALSRDGASTNIGYALGGLLIIISVDTAYANAYLDTPLNPRENAVPDCLKWWQKGFSWNSKAPADVRSKWIRTSLRVAISYFGMLMGWVGWFNLIDDQLGGFGGAIGNALGGGDGAVSISVYYDTVATCSWLFLGLGVLILLLTDTFYNMACIFPPEIEPRRRFKHFDDLKTGFSCDALWLWILAWPTDQGLAFLRLLVSIFAQNLVWNGMYNLAEYGPLIERLPINWENRPLPTYAFVSNETKWRENYAGGPWVIFIFQSVWLVRLTTLFTP